MPYSYNKAIIDHPDMKEFLEGQWMAHLRYGERIAELEAALRQLHEATLHPDNVLRGAGVREALDRAEKLLSR